MADVTSTLSISNCIKCKWIKHSSQKAEIIKTDFKKTQDPTTCC